MEKAKHGPQHPPTLNWLAESDPFVENLTFACGFYEQVLGLRKVETTRDKEEGKTYEYDSHGHRHEV